MSAAAAMSATLVSWSPFFASTRMAAVRRSRRVRSRRRSKRFVGATRSEALFISEYRFTIRYLPLLSSTPVSLGEPAGIGQDGCCERPEGYSRADPWSGGSAYAPPELRLL